MAKLPSTPRLHEVLAVEQSLAATARKINGETIKTFGSKNEHFMAMHTAVKHFAAEDAHLNVEDGKEMPTTVFEKLTYNARSNVKAWDAYMQKSATNQTARADIMIDGTIIAEDVPAEALLGMEQKIADLRAVYEAIPTLAPGPDWQPDPSQKPGVYRAARIDTTFRTRKVTKPVVLVPATEHHPAQVDKVVEDVPIASLERSTWSSMLTPAEKSDLLERIDALLRATKEARNRANSAEVVKCSIGKAVFSYIHGSIVKS